MKKTYSLKNFSRGINENLTEAASDIINFNLRTDGALVTRYGIDFGGNGTESMTYIDNSSGTGTLGNVVQIFFIKGRRFVQTTSGLWYAGATDSWLVDNRTIIADGTLWTTDYWATRYHVVVADQNRAFLANGKNQFWLDLQWEEQYADDYPILYNWGMDAPSFVDGDIVKSTSGGTIEAGFYAYALCYQNHHGGMSPLSNRVVVQHEPDQPNPGNENRAIITFDVPVDKQVKYVNIYRTDKQEPILATTSEIEGTLAQSASLKLIRQHNISAAVAAQSPAELVDTDASRAYGIAQLASTEFTSKPPDSLNHIVLYAGRIWGSMVQESTATLPADPDMLCFTAIDESAAPLYDIWPLAKSTDGVGTNPLTDANLSPAVPHQIKPRDTIRAIGHSRNYIAIFGDASIQLGKGHGVIEGLYNIKLPNTDLDFSDFLDSIGGKDFCISEMNGNLYFLSPADVRIYRLDANGQVSWISAPIQEALNTYTETKIQNIVADDGLVYVLVTDETSKQSDIYVYEEFRDTWTHHNVGVTNMSNLAVNTMDNTYVSRGNSNFSAPVSTTYASGSPGLYAMGEKSSSSVFYRLFDSQTGHVDDGANIQVSYTSEEFVFAKPTRMDTARIGIEGSSSLVTLKIEVDGEADAVTVPSLGTTYTLSKTNNYSVRTFATGYRFKVKFELSGSQTVRFLEIQFRGK